MSHKINTDKLYSELDKSFQDVLDEQYYRWHYHSTSVPHSENIDEVRQYDSFGRMIMTDQPGDSVKRKAVTNESGQVVGFRNAERDNRAVVVGILIAFILFFALCAASGALNELAGGL